jgi:hypothetical protein
MSHVVGQELPIETEGSSEFIENRLRLRKYFREFKLHSTKFWRDSAPKTNWEEIKSDSEKLLEDHKIAEKKLEEMNLQKKDHDVKMQTMKD